MAERAWATAETLSRAATAASRSIRALLPGGSAFVEADPSHRARILWICLGIGVVVSLFGVLVEHLQGDALGFRISATSTLLWAGCFGLLWKTRRSVLVANLAALVALVHLGAKWLWTWGDAQSLAMVAIVPALITVALGVRWGLLWTASSVAVLGVLVALSRPTFDYGVHLWWANTAFTSIFCAGVLVAEHLRVRARAETERIRRSLTAERMRFGEVIDASFQLIVETDARDRIRFASPQVCRAVGIPHDALIGSSALPLVHPEDRDTVVRGFLLDSKERRRAEVRMTDGKGGWRWYEVATGTYRTPEGERRRIFAGRDVTQERAERERRLQVQKLESLGVLAGGLAHDFNNLLTIIQGHAELLDPCESSEAIRDAAERAADLTRKLLSVGRKQMLRPEVVSLNRIVHDAEPMIRGLLREDVVLGLELADEPVAIEADPGQVEQALFNLVSNASDAMPDGGSLQIVTARRGIGEAEARELGLDAREAVMLQVVDSGQGMEEETLRHALDPFFTTKSLGTGLGLPSVSGIAEQSHASLRIESVPGAGTRVELLFPATAEPTLAESVAAPRGVAATAGGESVLVVEDEARVRGIIASTLRRMGHRPFEAADGAEALRLAPPDLDLLVTDVIMPGMRGSELAARLQEQNRRLRVLFVSGYDDEAGLASSPDPRVRFLAKPFTPSGLAAAVEELLGTARSAAPRPAEAAR